MVELCFSPRVHCAMYRIRWMHQVFLNFGHSHYSDLSKYKLNFPNATHEHLYGRFTTFCVLERVIIKGTCSNMNCSRIHVWFAVRVLYRVSHIIIQGFTITVQFISFNLLRKVVYVPCISISVYNHNWPRYVAQYLAFFYWRVSETGGIYTLSDLHKHSWAPHVQSLRRTFKRPITWSLARYHRIIFQLSL